MAELSGSEVVNYRGQPDNAYGAFGVSGNRSVWNQDSSNASWQNFAVLKAQRDKQLLDDQIAAQAKAAADLQQNLDISKAWDIHIPALTEEKKALYADGAMHYKELAEPDNPYTIEFMKKVADLQAKVGISAQLQKQYETAQELYNKTPEFQNDNNKKTLNDFYSSGDNMDYQMQNPVVLGATPQVDITSIQGQLDNTLGLQDAITTSFDPATAIITTTKEGKRNLADTESAVAAAYNQTDKESKMANSVWAQNMYKNLTPMDKAQDVIQNIEFIAKYHPEQLQGLPGLTYTVTNKIGNKITQYKSTDAWTQEDVAAYNALPDSEKENFYKLTPNEANQVVKQALPNAETYWNLAVTPAVMSKHTLDTQHDVDPLYMANYQHSLKRQEENAGLITDIRDKTQKVDQTVKDLINNGADSNTVYTHLSNNVGLPVTNITIGGQNVTALDLNNAQIANTPMQFSDQSMVLDGGTWETVKTYNDKHPSNKINGTGLPSTGLPGDGYNGLYTPKTSLLTYGTDKNYTPADIPNNSTPYVMFGVDVMRQGGKNITIFNTYDLNSTDQAESLNRLLNTEKLYKKTDQTNNQTDDQSQPTINTDKHEKFNY